MSRIYKLVLLIISPLLLSSCYYLQRTGAPLEVIEFPIAKEKGVVARDLIVLLPGIGDYPEAFQRNEFIRTLRHQQDLAADAVAVNSHIGYYTDRSLLDRLKEDVVEPAFSRGYERIHFVGVSLGGYGSLLYMRSHPDDVTSVILVAPYLGEPEHYNYLLGLSGWGEPVRARENIWPWLESLPKETLAQIYLGYGDSDDYATGQILLSRLLPTGNSTSVVGDHSWVTWQSLWPELLSRADPLHDDGEEVIAER
jgi:pimeloyl-ACP methyl ester carboxylesterase